MKSNLQREELATLAIASSGFYLLDVWADILSQEDPITYIVGVS